MSQAPATTPRRRPFVLAALVAMGVCFVAGIAGSASAAPKPPAANNAARSPYGTMDLAWSEPGLIGLVGWAKDPDIDRPIDVVVAIDNQLYVRRAGVFNPFLGGNYFQKFRSYLVAIPVSPGPHTMCVAALNVGRGDPFRLLGCKSFDIPTPDPIGNLEDVTPSPNGDSARISGWALDQENPFPLPLTVTVDGADAGRLVAAQNRPDIGASFPAAATLPAAGNLHGFSGDIPARPGSHRVCVRAQNIGRGADAVIGCQQVEVTRVQPLGSIDTVTVVANAIAVSGWAADPDAGGPIRVRISDRVIGDIDDPVVTEVDAAGSRPDVGSTVGVDPRAGFGLTIPTTKAGRHEICVTALNRNAGSSVQLPCAQVDVVDLRPVQALDVESRPAGVRVSGWAFDPNDAATVGVRVSIDGSVTATAANQSRPDVGAAYPGVGPNRGVDVTINGLSAGRHTVCVTFVDRGAAAGGLVGDRTPACGSVVVGATAVGTPGTAGGPTGVGPAPSSSITRVDRDAGVTTTLRDGSVLWLFGDSIEYNADGSLKYFVGGTGAWSAPGAPAVTRDAVDGAGRPFLLATPGAGYPTCGGTNPNPIMWPISAVTVPAGAQDRVIVYLSNMCVGDGTFELRGLSVAEWFYNPAAPPAESPVQLTILNQNLGGGSQTPPRYYGTGAVYDPASGYLVLHQCDRPANLANVGQFGPCRAARVLPGNVTNTGLYEYWNATTWVTSSASAAAMDMPAGSLAGYNYPASAFTVAWDPVHNVYVMAYTPWPGMVDQIAVRVARNPQGPWTAPMPIVLPGCTNTIDGALKGCYAGTAQPSFSSNGQLGLGYSDQAIAADRKRGQYQLVRVPFHVTLS